MPTPEFILSLREKIGHDPLWMPGVTAVVFNEGGQVLLCRRSDNGAWTPITGIVDPGEEPAVTAVREAEEEAGVVIEVAGLASVKANPPQTFPNGDQAQFLDLTFRCRYVSGEARVNDEESSDMMWADLDDLPPMNDRMLYRLRSASEFSGRTWFSLDGLDT